MLPEHIEDLFDGVGDGGWGQQPDLLKRKNDKKESIYFFK